MIRILIIQLFLFSLLTTLANAEIVESWICQENSDGDWSGIIAKANVNKGKEDGVVEILGGKNMTNFEMRAINRRWNFGSSFQYSFVIKPNGEAMYYDYSKLSDGEVIKPQLNIFCKQKELAKKKGPGKKINRQEDTPVHN